MSDSNSGYPSWFLWIWEKGLGGWLIAIIILASACVGAYWMDRRLDGIERHVVGEAPTRYEPPNLADYVADEPAPDSVVRRQTIYLPIYSHVYYNGGRPCLLEATVSIRNTDETRPLYVRRVDYFDTKGQRKKQFVDRLIRLGPLETVDFLIPARDLTGGSGGNIMMDGFATDPLEAPMVEAVMVGVAGANGVCFRSTGRPLEKPSATGG